MLALRFKTRVISPGGRIARAPFQLSAPVSGPAFRCGAASGALSLPFRGNTRVEEACEMYTRAANMFKIAKNWSGEYGPRRCGGAAERVADAGVTRGRPSIFLQELGVLHPRLFPWGWSLWRCNSSARPGPAMISIWGGGWSEGVTWMFPMLN